MGSVAAAAAYRGTLPVSLKGVVGSFRSYLQATVSKTSRIYVMPGNNFEIYGLWKTYRKFRNHTCSNGPLKPLVVPPVVLRCCGKGHRALLLLPWPAGETPLGSSIRGSGGASEPSSKRHFSNDTSFASFRKSIFGTNLLWNMPRHFWHHPCSSAPLESLAWLPRVTVLQGTGTPHSVTAAAAYKGTPFR